ncbi:MAG: phosphatidylglycerophosphatase A [Deltaproteobacteria bacterium]|nr:phosphatidylglycerophosphatase A [Deltaproteobacteria bacterium]
MNEKFIKILATGFGSGLCPVAPGTAGTAIAVPVYLLIAPLAWPLYLMTVLAFTFLAVYVSQEAEKIYGQKDAQPIVIDEIAGFLWTMFLITPTVLHCAIGFLLFRFFDIVKIFPADYFQRKLPGGYGVVADDWAAGVYGNILLLIAIKLFNI